MKSPIARVIMTVPKSEAFVTWRTLTGASPEEIAKSAVTAFPWPLERLVWGAAAAAPEKDGLLVMFAAIPRERVAHYEARAAEAGETLHGLSLRFVADWVWFRNTHPDQAKNGGSVLIHNDGTATELTFIHRGFPVFCRSVAPDGAVDVSTEIDKTTGYLRQARGIPDDIAFYSMLVPAGASKDALTPDELDVPWFVRPEEPVPPVTRAWRRHKNRMLSIIALMLTGASFAMNATRQNDRLRLSKLERDARPIASADNALRTFVETVRRVPPRAHLVGYRYDAGQKSFQVEGRAADYGLVSTYLAALAKEGLFRNVSAGKSKLGAAGGQAVVEFSIEGSLK